MICPVCTPANEITWGDLVADQVELCTRHWAEKHRFLSADLTTARNDEAGPFTSAVLAMICTLPRKSK